MRQVRNQRKHAPPVTSFALCRFILYALPVRLHRMVYWIAVLLAHTVFRH